MRDLQVQAERTGRAMDDVSGPRMQRRMEAQARQERAMREEMSGLSRESDRASSSFSRLEQRSRGVETQSRRTSAEVSKLDGHVKKLLGWGAAVTAVSGLVNVLGALAGGALELLPRIGDLAGAGAGLASVYVGAGAAMGTVKLATSGLSEALKGNKQALKGLTPDARAFVAQLKSMSPELQTLRESAQRGMFGGADNLLTSLRRQAPQINRIVSSTSRSVGGLANFAAGQITPEFMRNLTGVVGEGNVAFSAAGRSATYLGEALEQVMLAARPLVDWMSRMAVQESQAVLQHAKLARASGELGHYFDRTRSSLELFGQIGGRVFHGLHGVMHAASHDGDSLWKSIDRVAGRFDRWSNSTRGQNTMRKYFREIQPELRAVGRTLGQVVRLFADLGGGTGGMTKTIVLFGDLAGGADKLFRKLGPVGKDLGGLLTSLYAINKLSGGSLSKRLAGAVGGVRGGGGVGGAVRGALGGGNGGIVGIRGVPLKAGSLENPVGVFVVDQGGGMGIGGKGGKGGGAGGAAKTAERDAAKTAGRDAATAAERDAERGAGRAAARATARTAARVVGGHALGAVPIVGNAVAAYSTFRDLRSTHSFDWMLGTQGRPQGSTAVPSSRAPAPGHAGVYAPAGGIPTFIRPQSQTAGVDTGHPQLGGLSIDATIKKLDQLAAAARKAGDVRFRLADRLGAELLKTRSVNSRGVRQLMAQWDQLPPAARSSAAAAMVRMSRELEAKGKLPRNTTDRLQRAIAQNFSQMGAQAAQSAATMAKKIGGSTQDAAQMTMRNMGSFTSSVQSAMSSGAISTAQGMQVLIANLNAALRKVGAKPLGQLQVVMMQNLAEGKGHSIPGHGHATGGRLPGPAMGDHIPLMSRGGAMLGIADGGELVVNRHTERRVDDVLGMFGTRLSSMVANETRPHFSHGGRVPGYATGGRVGYGQLEGLWTGAGGPRAQAPLAAAIADAESGGNPNAHNPSGASGLWQILGNPFPGNPMDPETNARMAVSKWRSAHGFTPWVTYTSGAYREYLHGGIPAQGGFGGAGWTNLRPPRLRGHGAVADTSRRALTRATGAANAYGQAHTPQSSETSVGMVGGRHRHEREVGGPRLRAMIHEANAIASHDYNYRWGGGHGALGVPSAGIGGHGSGPGVGFDCSGAVSAVLGAGGLVDHVYDAAGYMAYGQPGEGKQVSVYASPGHVFMRLAGNYFGTSTAFNPGGGANWMPRKPESMPSTRHPRGFAYGGSVPVKPPIRPHGWMLDDRELPLDERRRRRRNPHATLPGMSEGGRLPDWGGWNGRGADVTVHRPTVFGAGDRGIEHIRITPGGRPSDGNVIHIAPGAVQVNSAGGGVSEPRVQKIVTRRLRRFAEEVAAEIEAGAEQDPRQVMA